MNNDRGAAVEKISSSSMMMASTSTTTTIMRQQQQQQQLQQQQHQQEQISEERFEEKEMPTRTPIGILMKHGSDSESSVKGNKPKKRVQIQTDVSIV